MNKGFLLLVMFAMLNLVAGSQTFTGAGGQIPEGVTPGHYPIEVPELPQPGINAGFGLESVCLKIMHPWVSDLEIGLLAPDSTFVELASCLAWDGDNYFNTCFDNNSQIPVILEWAPFIGTFHPSGDLGIVNNGQAGTGTWQLVILDNRPWANQGTLIQWSLNFGDVPSLPFGFESSNLPIVVINTQGRYIPDDPKIIARMGIIDNGPGQRNHMSDPFNAYDGYIGIERRGSSSQDFPKKSYGFETCDSAGVESDVPLLGMPEESDWVLNAHYTDKSLMRNNLTYYLSNRMGRYASRTVFCEVVLNGQYWGVYVLMEKVKRDQNRVDIARLDETDTIAPGLTGGYILKIDKETGAGGQGWESPYPPTIHPNGQSIFIQYEYPDYPGMLPEQTRYIQDYIDTFETALYQFQGEAPFLHHQYIDIPSFVDYFILTELSKNIDGYRLSTFFYKDQEGKINMGPAWDYDLAWGNANYCEATEQGGWIYRFGEYCPGDQWQPPFWWDKLMLDSVFLNALSCRWQELSSSFLQFDTIHDYITAQEDMLAEAQQRNFTQWPILGEWVWPNPWPIPETYHEEVMNLRLFAMKRLSWLNGYMPQHCAHESVQEQPEFIPAIYPNPARDILHIILPSSGSRINKLELFNSVGRKVRSANLQNPHSQLDLTALSPGMYFLKICQGNQVIYSRIIKTD